MEDSESDRSIALAHSLGIFYMGAFFGASAFLPFFLGWLVFSFS